MIHVLCVFNLGMIFNYIINANTKEGNLYKTSSKEHFYVCKVRHLKSFTMLERAEGE